MVRGSGRHEQQTLELLKLALVRTADEEMVEEHVLFSRVKIERHEHVHLARVAHQPRQELYRWRGVGPLLHGFTM
jgi:hypothetical protein